MKSDIVFKKAFNDALIALAALPDGDHLPSEHSIGRQLGVSRTTVRKVLTALVERGALRLEDGGYRPTGATTEAYPDAETVSTSQQVESLFMEWMLRENIRPGTTINELDLSRRFGVATTSIREFLNRFQRFGLITKRPNSGWTFNGFTEEFALELFEIREMFELRSARAFAQSSPSHSRWQALSRLLAEHIALLDEIDERFHDFSELDSRFHQLINSAAPNRFIDGFYDIITMIFHYHYQWHKQDERQRNELALREHIRYIQALQKRDLAAVDRTCRDHLSSAKRTLLAASQKWNEPAGAQT